MVADIGTRRGATIDDVMPDAPWDVGLPWMRNHVSEFPVNRYNDIKLSSEEKQFVENDVVKGAKKVEIGSQKKCHVDTNNPLPEEVSERYKFSMYYIDPNKHRY